jgi:hypothetical protein
MTIHGKVTVTMPLYAVVDMCRPLPNFLIKRRVPWTILVFSTAKNASEFATGMMKIDPKLKLDFSIIHTCEELRGILVALSDLLPLLRIVHLDPSTARRTPQRFWVKDMIDGVFKKR